LDIYILYLINPICKSLLIVSFSKGINLIGIWKDGGEPTGSVFNSKTILSPGWDGSILVEAFLKKKEP
jgi:hypothetical protein